jgi:hypothetical protein
MAQFNLPSAASLVFQKEAQIQALWAVYTAVQFTLGGFGLAQYHDGLKMPPVLGFSVLFGVWAFNFGHLSMILKCISQREVIAEELSNNPTISDAEKPGILRVISGEKKRSLSTIVFGKGYVIAILVHLFIDGCASVALLSRVDLSWIRIG